MKKLFATAIALICFLLVNEANAQALQKVPADSIAAENVESERLRDTSFHCHFGSDRVPKYAIIVYPGKQNRTGFKNQNMRIVSNRDFRNLEMGIGGYSY